MKDLSKDFIIDRIFDWFYYEDCRLGLWCLMPLSTIVQLYRGSKFSEILSNMILNIHGMVDPNA